MTKIELWSKKIEIGKQLEEIERNLSSAIMNKMYPAMCAEMKEGAVMSHYGLTTINESVRYTLEYLIKNKILEKKE